jgi:hypothetical protein
MIAVRGRIVHVLMNIFHYIMFQRTRDYGNCEFVEFFKFMRFGESMSVSLHLR